MGKGHEEDGKPSLNGRGTDLYMEGLGSSSSTKINKEKDANKSSRVWSSNWDKNLPAMVDLHCNGRMHCCAVLSFSEAKTWNLGILAAEIRNLYNYLRHYSSRFIPGLIYKLVTNLYFFFIHHCILEKGSLKQWEHIWASIGGWNNFNWANLLTVEKTF